MTKLVQKRILLSPLNWGLGHASRLIPIIKHLEAQGHICIIGAESLSAELLKKAFPHLIHEYFPGFNVRFSSGHTQWFKILLQIPKFLYWKRKENHTTQKLIQKHQIDLIISDNRYGVNSKLVPSILITHQTSPYLGRLFFFLRPLVTKTIRKWIRSFDQCWIPDIQEVLSVSGSLSESIPLPNHTHHIGLLSRLNASNMDTISNAEAPVVDILAILSGPEPHRSQLEKIIIDRFKNDTFKVMLLQGQPELNAKSKEIGNVTLLPHCTDSYLYQLMTKSALIICRSGYSTIMDLFAVNRKAILIPTPGQYEQEYLADHLSRNFEFATIPQHELATKSMQIPDVSCGKKFANASDFFLQLPPLP